MSQLRKQGRVIPESSRVGGPFPSSEYNAVAEMANEYIRNQSTVPVRGRSAIQRLIVSATATGESDTIYCTTPDGLELIKVKVPSALADNLGEYAEGDEILAGTGIIGGTEHGGDATWHDLNWDGKPCDVLGVEPGFNLVIEDFTENIPHQYYSTAQRRWIFIPVVSVGVRLEGGAPLIGTVPPNDTNTLQKYLEQAGPPVKTGCVQTTFNLSSGIPYVRGTQELPITREGIHESSRWVNQRTTTPGGFEDTNFTNFGQLLFSNTSRVPYLKITRIDTDPQIIVIDTISTGETSRLVQSTELQQSQAGPVTADLAQRWVSLYDFEDTMTEGVFQVEMSGQYYSNNSQLQATMTGASSPIFKVTLRRGYLPEGGDKVFEYTSTADALNFASLSPIQFTYDANQGLII